MFNLRYFPPETPTAPLLGPAAAKTGRTGRVPFLPLAALLLACGCCASLLNLPGHLEDSWTPLSPNGYRFSNQDLELEFRPDPKGVFHWRIKNKSRVVLTITHDRLALRRSGDTTAYTLWGKPREKEAGIAPIVVKPGGFVSFSFPVLLRGPFFPFKPQKERPIWLEIQARWGRQRFDYKLVFPTAPTP